MQKIESIAKFLEHGTIPEAALAFQSQPHICRSFFATKTLADILLRQRDLIQQHSSWKVLVEEVIRRLLIVADRGHWRDTFIQVLDTGENRHDPINRFVTDHYVERRARDFAASERDYIRGMESLREEDTEYRGPIYDALSWFGATPGTRAKDVRVLFSNTVLAERFPPLMLDGLCVRFEFTEHKGSEPFPQYDRERIGLKFRRSAGEAESKAYELCGRDDFSRHRRLRIRGDLIELSPEGSPIDGTSAYLSFLVANFCILQSCPLSPYVGIAGVFNFQRVEEVVDMPPKITAAIDAGMHVLYLPQGNLDRLSAEELPDEHVLRLVPYDEHSDLKDICSQIFQEIKSIGGDLVLPVDEKTDDQDCGTDEPASLAPIEETLQQARPLLGELECFLEFGGYSGLSAPARTSTFNPDDNTFVTVFPSETRFYRFDLQGRLLAKFSSEGMVPLSIAWLDKSREYAIGFADGTVRTFSSDFELKRKFTMPIGVEPRWVESLGDWLFVADCRSNYLWRLSLRDKALRCVDLGNPITDIESSEELGQLVVGLRHGAAIVDSGLKIVWQTEHAGSFSAVAYSSEGQVWVGLSTGGIWKFDSQNKKQIDVNIDSEINALAPLDKSVIAGSVDGKITLLDDWGNVLGTDQLETQVFDICAVEGDLLVLSTACGSTVVKPFPAALRRTADNEQMNRAFARLEIWEKLAETPPKLIEQVKNDFEDLDFSKWFDVFALRRALQDRRRQLPKIYANIERAFQMVDERKAKLLGETTTPVIIDGSNVTRDCWNTVHPKPRRKPPSRLGDLVRMRDALAREQNPILYPIITVVDVTERHTTDDLAELKSMIRSGEILETSPNREADSLIFSLVKENDWSDCQIISKDYRMFEAHAEMLPELDSDWYKRVQRAFVFNRGTGEISFPERSRNERR